MGRWGQRRPLGWRGVVIVRKGEITAGERSSGLEETVDRAKPSLSRTWSHRGSNDRYEAVSHNYLGSLDEATSKLILASNAVKHLA